MYKSKLRTSIGQNSNPISMAICQNCGSGCAYGCLTSCLYICADNCDNDCTRECGISCNERCGYVGLLTLSEKVSS